jgi:hypothetical protein
MDWNEAQDESLGSPVAISKLLGAVPTLGSWREWAARIEDLVEIAKTTPSATVRAFAAVDGKALVSKNGWLLESDEAWGFWAATLVADWAVYESRADRVDAARLLFVMTRFPAGFRTWFGQTEEGWLPLGYTGWYPVEEATFARMENNTPPLADRAIVPLTILPARPYLYVFNYSIVQSLQSTPFSGRLMRELAADITRATPAGLAAIAVSDDGIRIAERFGMRKTGEFAVDGEKEWILTGRRS